ncbi:hypothetical protein [Longimicrobium sp.]|uniref:hypothetical protein n=1 Tax=Longimicrobium sp. TaxID=2029185 RepID=UPI002E3025C7|nr:hypothetical protein [Longimicrobium sp.]HEX6040554.1 hypothetical protein [Longimicrobium sp.]
MIRRLPASACLLPALLATGLAAQDDRPRCPNGESRADGINISVALHAHPTRVAATLDSLLVKDGYEVRGSPNATGNWSIAPRFTYLDETRGEEWTQAPHPGVLLMVATAARADSTDVEIGARVLCNPPSGKAEDAMSPVGLLTAMHLAAGLTMAMDTLAARGVDLHAPVRRSRVSIQIPDSVGEFAFAGREDYEDPRLGSSVRYARESDGLFFDVYVYPGPPADERCPQACAEDWVREEAQGFIDSGPELIRRGHFRRMNVKRNEPIPVTDGAGYRAGREIVMEVEREDAPGTPMESRYILFSYPGFLVKVRGTYPPSDKAEGTVRAFVSEMLVKLTGG